MTWARAVGEAIVVHAGQPVLIPPFMCLNTFSPPPSVNTRTLEAQTENRYQNAHDLLVCSFRPAVIPRPPFHLHLHQDPIFLDNSEDWYESISVL